MFTAERVISGLADDRNRRGLELVLDGGPLLDCWEDVLLDDLAVGWTVPVSDVSVRVVEVRGHGEAEIARVDPYVRPGCEGAYRGHERRKLRDLGRHLLLLLLGRLRLPAEQHGVTDHPYSSTRTVALTLNSPMSPARCPP